MQTFMPPPPATLYCGSEAFVIGGFFFFFKLLAMLFRIVKVHVRIVGMGYGER